MKYKDLIKLNFDYNKSINILFDKKVEYIETTSSKKALKALKYHNSIALIGPFGSGKSAFMLYLDNLIKEKKFLKDYKSIKIVADNRTFLDNLKEVLGIRGNLKEILDSIKNKKIIFLIDEFGKFLENDLDIQNFVEFINKDKNLKIVVSLHKSFSEYKKDFSKIAGRFENIIFRDDINESIKILKKALVHKGEISSKKYIKEITSNSDYLDLAPLHPFSVKAIIEIFNKFFQNQRSIFSFLFSNEKGGFSEFLNNESQKLYSLSELYDYLDYLLEVYDIALIDKEAYYLSKDRIKSLEGIYKDLLKAISVVDIFKINLNLDEKNLYKTFIDRYSKDEINEALKYLKSKNFITFLVNKNSFSIVEDLNIDLNKELEDKKSLLKIEDKDINEFIFKTYEAKEFFIEYGNRVEFERVYNLNSDYKIILSNEAIKNEKSVTLKVDFDDYFYESLKELKALKEIKEENLYSISNKSKEILEEMIEDKKEFLDRLIEEKINNSLIVYENKEYKYSYKTLQNLMSKIAKKFIYKTPKINNYTLIHTTSKAQNTSILKKLYEAMLTNSDKENLAIEKYPPHKALYLSVIKASGIHRKNRLTYPNALNFEYIFEFFDEELKEYRFVNELLEKLEKEPFKLRDIISLFLLNVYIIVNKEFISLFNDKGFVFDLNADILIHLTKNPKKYKLKKVTLSEKEKKLFKEYATLIFKEDIEYNKDILLSIVKELYKRFNSLPLYSKYTKTISNEAQKLRSAFFSERDPFNALFITFPQILGEDDFIEKFRKYFNEIVFSYQKMIVELENYIKRAFLFNRNFPFDISKLNEDNENKIYLNAFINSNSIVELIDNLGILLVNKTSKEFLDSDVELFKEKIDEIAKKILLKSNLDKNYAKIILAKSDKVIEEVVKLKDDKKVEKYLKELKNLDKEEKLLLISKLLEEIK